MKEKDIINYWRATVEKLQLALDVYVPLASDIILHMITIYLEFFMLDAGKRKYFQISGNGLSKARFSRGQSPDGFQAVFPLS